MSFKKLGEITVDEVVTENSNNLISSDAVYDFTKDDLTYVDETIAPDGVNPIASLISNSNLLINGDFQVNQRGGGTSASDQYSGSNKYTVDRWVITNGATVYKNSDGSIHLTLPQQYAVIRQRFEDVDYNKLLGKTVTASIKVKNTNFARSSRHIYIYGNSSNLAGTSITGDGIFSVTTTLPATLSNFDVRIITYASGSQTDEFDIEWVKLEVGSYNTSFSPRLYAEELALCQRYYQTALYEFNFYALNTTVGYGHINLVTTMRITPTATFPKGYIHGNNSYLGEPTNIGVGAIKDNCIRFWVNNTYTQNGLYMLESQNVITLDSEIY